ncbi:hypothetical protein HY933_01085 [Candidatus Falkowbacteria bacterium]|nr:hypothetical protein [Candidatus Falkowbacteria bacterium]
MAWRTGVCLVLAPGVRIPVWIRLYTGFYQVGRMLWSGADGRTVRMRYLDLWRSRASFFPGGSVGVSLPGMGGSVIGFGPRAVREIRTLGGRLIKSNHYLCRRCGAIAKDVTTRTASTREGAQPGLYHGTFHCAACDYTWTLPNI